MSDVLIDGFVADGFEPVREAFQANFTDHGDVGASVGLYVGGELKVDLVGGIADPATGAPYTADTLQLVFSTTKGAAAICAHQLADRGLLDFDAPVTEYWPEFGQAGKQDVPVRWLLSHRVGLPVVDDPPPLEEVLRWDPIIEALAAQQPVWEPGSAHGYHALTYGWLVGEIVRRVSGQSIGEFFQENVAGPLGIEFWIGLPDREQHRVSNMIPSVPGEGALPDLSKLPPEIAERLGDMAAAAFDQSSLMNRCLSLDGTFSLEGKLPWNTDAVRAAQIPAANGITNGRSLAKMYAATVGEVDGVRLLSKDAVDRACEEQSNGRDQCLIVDTRFGLGFFLPSTFAVLAGPGSFGHAGAGGSLGLADRDLGIGFGYVMNKMSLGLSDDPRALHLVEAVKACL
jgi:CubicO group peptidase (beta-lactamase class C family)